MLMMSTPPLLSHHHNHTNTSAGRAATEYDTESDDEEVRAACAAIMLTDNNANNNNSAPPPSPAAAVLPTLRLSILGLSERADARAVLLDAGTRARASVDAVIQGAWLHPSIGLAALDQLQVCRAVLNAVCADNQKAGEEEGNVSVMMMMPPPTLEDDATVEGVEAQLACAVAYMAEMQQVCEPDEEVVDDEGAPRGEHTFGECARLAHALLGRMRLATQSPRLSSPASPLPGNSSSDDNDAVAGVAAQQQPPPLQLKKRRSFAAAEATAGGDTADDSIARRVLARRRILVG